MATRRAALACAVALLGAVVLPARPAFAGADLKEQLEQGNAAYLEAFNKQDVAGVIAYYAPGAVVVSPTGPKTDIPALFEAFFKAGIHHLEATVDQAWPLGPDTALGMGRYRITLKDRRGASTEATGFWTATYVQEGGKWKIRMSSIIPQMSPPGK